MPTNLTTGLPIIGLTPDAGETFARSGRPSLPRYELKAAYTNAVIKAGGVPIILPYMDDPAAISAALALCDGLVFTGGAFDIPPSLYGEKPHQQLGAMHPVRTHFEQLALRAALGAGLPILGVCGGMQLLAVELGATLIQDIKSELPNALEHEQPNDSREPSHAIRIEEGSLLHRCTGRLTMMVNTTHHQAVKQSARSADRVRVSGVAPDGVIEAIELVSVSGAAPERFVLGVEWHPELMAGDEQLSIYRALVRAADARAHG